MAEFFDTLNERSSIRGYEKKELTNEQIDLLIEAGLKAPTARNLQEVYISALKTSDPLAKEIQKELNPNASNTFYYDAPVLFFLSAETGFKWSFLDSGIAVENMHLAAKDMGLGSVILGCIDEVMLGEKKACFAEKLNIPEGYSFTIALAVGYPAVEKKQHDIDKEAKSSIID